MKYLLLTLVLFGTLQAQDLTPSEVFKTYNYNHGISAKIKHKRLLQKMAIVKKDKAYKIAESSCESEVIFSKLSVHNRRLFYSVKTASCSIKIDALDASIISKITF